MQPLKSKEEGRHQCANLSSEWGNRIRTGGKPEQQRDRWEEWQAQKREETDPHTVAVGSKCDRVTGTLGELGELGVAQQGADVGWIEMMFRQSAEEADRGPFFQTAMLLCWAKTKAGPDP